MSLVMLKELLEKAPEIKIKFSNLTSETQVNEGVRMSNAFSDGCLLELPKASCALGHQVLITLFIRTKSIGKKKIEIVGKVIEVNLTTEMMAEVKVQFNQYLKEEWNLLIGLLEQTQNQISQVIEELKTPKP